MSVVQIGFETESSGLTLSTSSAGTIARDVDGAITGEYGLRAQAPPLEYAVATQDTPTPVAAGGRHVVGVALRAATVATSLVMRSAAFELWLMEDASLRLDVIHGRAGETLALSSISSSASAIAAGCQARVVVEIVRDSADGAEDGQARLWLDGELLGERDALDLWQSASVIGVTLGADCRYMQHDFEFDSSRANDRQCLAQGSARLDATVYRNAVSFDGAVNAYESLVIPAANTTVTMALIPAHNGALEYYYGSEEFAFGVNASGNVQMAYCGQIATGPAVVTGSEQVWEMTSTTTSATLSIDGTQVAQITGASGTFNDYEGYIGAIQTVSGAANFSEMDLLTLMVVEDGSTVQRLTCHRNTLNTTTGEIYDQSSAGNDAESVGGADLTALVVSTRDVGLESSALVGATAIFEDPVGTSVRPFVNDESWTMCCEIRVTGDLLETRNVIGYSWGSGVAGWLGLVFVNETLKWQISNGSASQSEIISAAPSSFTRYALVIDVDTLGSEVVRVYRDGVEIVNEAITLTGTVPKFSSGGKAGYGLAYSASTVESALEIKTLRFDSRAMSSAEAIAWTGGA
ncbi:MAG: hypothetical protein HN909_06055 [Phycisphaerales bacterium]|jgi:hypothetical protein|nr:hypothetical protein [Phycisphaerales bacterium]MBT7171316.1 hypothetical protein [Phycisphaerales bacterium]